MNLRTSLLFAGAGAGASLVAAVAAGLISLGGLTPSSARAQNVVVEAPPGSTGGTLQTAPRIEQYKVVDISAVSVARASGGPVGTLEAVLNGMAAEGWRLRETTGNYLIFAR
ncbi:hypothetical protein [Verrucomicrobium sp. BvORR034]|jgi:hypothetical protein|uniref:hypothetical protein n=1 Tax=Verrucomicrobium sp. BvORR034 TaxID=1396418 RepID=UPI002240EB6E|nr:hypothetical protein [Verrucomicrobium sp. BvORR034]